MKTSMILQDLLKKYKMKLIMQTVIVLSLFSIIMVWEPVILQYLFNVVEAQRQEGLIQGAIVSMIIIALLIFLGYINNTYADMNSWSIINGERKGALEKFHFLQTDKVNEKFEPGDIFHCINHIGVASLQLWFNFIRIFSFLVSLGILIYLAYGISLWLLFIAISLFFIETVSMKVQTVIVLKYEEKIKNMQSQTDTFADCMMNNFEFIYMNDLELSQFCEYEILRKQCYQLEKRLFFILSMFECMLYIVSMGMKLLLAFFLFPLRMSGFLDVGLTTASFSVLEKIKQTLTDITAAIVSIPQNIVMLKSVNEILQYERKSIPDENKEEIIQVENVTMEFKDYLVLNDISLTIKQGEKVAIVGHNGCGKSTLLKSILGIYEPTDGKCYVRNGCSISWKEEFLKEIAYIPAKPCLLNKTSKENIDTVINQDIEINDFGLCNGFLESLPAQMSGGEQQRVNIVRGLNKKCDVLIADEPTSNLDGQGSMKAMKAMLNNHKTCLIITHDFDLLPLFSRIIIMDHGNIIADGSYDGVKNRLSKG